MNPHFNQIPQHPPEALLSGKCDSEQGQLQSPGQALGRLYVLVGAAVGGDKHGRPVVGIEQQEEGGATEKGEDPLTGGGDSVSVRFPQRNRTNRR